MLLGDDAIVPAKGEVLIGPDNKPVLTAEGALVLVNQSCTFMQNVALELMLKCPGAPTPGTR